MASGVSVLNPLMPGCRYVEEIGSAAMLAAKTFASVTLEVNLKECLMHIPLLSANKAIHPGFETQSPKQGCHWPFF